jgi:hypothetical protein
LENNDSTNLNKYEPTPSEQKLLEVLLNPLHYKKSVTEKCEIAGVDRGIFYIAMKKPEFCDLYNETIKSGLKASIGKVIQATEDFATRFPGNHQDRKILLEMAGAYTEKQEVKVTGEMIIDIKLTDEDEV